MGTSGVRRALTLTVVAMLALFAMATTAGAVTGPTTIISLPTLAAGAPDPNPDDIVFCGTSKGGSHVFFTTKAAMVPGDTDGGKRDVYERFAGKTTLVSASDDANDTTPADAKCDAATEDGSRVFFETTERMTPDDGDGSQNDVYERGGGHTYLISKTNAGFPDPGGRGAFFSGISRNGEKVFFVTNMSLTSADHDLGQQDLYERRLHTVTNLLSGATAKSDPGNGGADYSGNSDTGDLVWFSTFQSLNLEDKDAGRVDIYQHSNSITFLVSRPDTTLDPNSGDVSFAGNSADGNHIFFLTTQSLTGDDNDSHQADMYDRFAGHISLISKPDGITDPDSDGVTPNFVSQDGSRAFFTTTQKLNDKDNDGGKPDIYERTAGATLLVSDATGKADPASAGVTFAGASVDGTHVYFTTNQALTPDDKDTAQDVYQRFSGATTLISKANSGVSSKTADATYAGASDGGGRVYFNTVQKLTKDDTDNRASDIYERSGSGKKAETVLVSKATDKDTPKGGGATFAGNSALGSVVYFTTTQKLAVDDKDTLVDLYGAGSPDPGERPKPRITRLKVTKTAITFTTSEAGKVSLSFKRCSSVKRCVKGAGKITVKAKINNNKIKLKKKFAKGRYQVTATERGKISNKKSTPVKATFHR
jgi:hypothetical protein